MLSLHEAARSHRAYQRLIDAFRARETLDARDETGATPLHSALQAVVGTVALAAGAYALLALGAAPDEKDDRGVRPLHLACERGEPDTIRLLLVLGANPAASDHAGRTPLALATASAPPESVDVIRSWLLGEAPVPLQRMGMAEAAGHRVELTVLLREGGDPNERDALGRTALHTVDSDACCAALLARGADPNAKNERGETPLHVVCRGLDRKVELLLDNGADPTLADDAGRLPIEGLKRQSYPYDVYEGDRYEARRLRLIEALERAAQRYHSG